MLHNNKEVIFRHHHHNLHMFVSILPLQQCGIGPARTPCNGADWWGVYRFFSAQSTFGVSVKIFILVFVLQLRET